MSVLLRVLSFLREASGESAYEQYCRHLQTRHPNRSLPTEKEFYLARLRDKYTRPNRCC